MSYAYAARGSRQMGLVTRVLENGPIAVHWSVAQSSGFPRLDEATACVLRKLQFVAGRRDRQAVEAEAMLPIMFRLD